MCLNDLMMNVWHSCGLFDVNNMMINIDKPYCHIIYGVSRSDLWGFEAKRVQPRPTYREIPTGLKKIAGWRHIYT